MNIKRRNFLLFMAGSAGALTLSSSGGCNSNSANQSIISSGKSLFAFEPIKGTIPLNTMGLSPEDQKQQYSEYEIVDDLVLPKGYKYQVIAAWGDPVGDSRFGYNNDYLSFVPSDENQGYLSVNFEYISAIPWMQTYEKVIGTPLPFDEVKALLKGKNAVNAFALPNDNPLKNTISQICQAAFIDQGLGVISVRRTSSGKWERTNSPADRRITGISGLLDGRYLQATGPAVAVFRKKTGQGYIDKLNDRIIGTFGNCAGGTTPWGTVLSAEENFQAQVVEPVYADGTSFDPSKLPFVLDKKALFGQGNVFGLAGNKYGWIVEVDPANSQDYGTKHTWLGRYRHEAVGIRVESGKPLAFYSGCDRRGGHIYKFISSDRVKNPQNKANSQLLQKGMLYAAKFNPDGTGSWIPLKADTAVNPDLPSQVIGNLMRLPKGPPAPQLSLFPDVPDPVEGGNLEVTQDKEIAQYKNKYKQLGDLYIGNSEEKQGAILIDAHYAANAAGATCTARPEDTEVAPNGDLYISFTSGFPSKDGGPDIAIFKGPRGEVPYEYGWIMQLTEDNNDPGALTFKWQMLATGGEPAVGGLGFANPDNLLINSQGHVWMVTDISTSKMNKSLTNRTASQGKSTPFSHVFGNNAIWFIPTSGDSASQAFLFATGPMECEITGPCFTPDEQTMFVAIQHPGEANGIRRNNKSEIREIMINTTTGEEFLQKRQVPIGSNWPSKNPDTSPKPAIVAITF
ncbi:PhoX family protein [Calothrix rhizosoleniae]|uniref:PhoX family protein n=1 Tax=Calothrix rhizosoleniae TaxID=888997 RepID=UPI000B49F528|nr:alkaline phosphatase PhoX [Calothrix rhizosoleniae]